MTTANDTYLGSFTVVPVDADHGVIHEDTLELMNKKLQSQDATENPLVSKPRHVEIAGDYILVEGVQSMPDEYIGIPREDYERLQFDGVSTRDEFVRLPRPDVLEEIGLDPI